jgi:hypothetical protein
LAELGLVDRPPEADVEPAPEASRWNLRSFQLDVEAARRAIDAQAQAMAAGTSGPEAGAQRTAGDRPADYRGTPPEAPKEKA